MHSRRTLIKSSMASILAAGAAPAILRAQNPGARHAAALVGAGWWGANILREAIASGACNIVALVDPDPGQIDKCWGELGRLTADQPRRYQDYREMLQKEKPQIVINATPDHWHPLITIDAVAAGAHVYVEKPICHTINEGIAMVKAARAANRIVQVGTHRRVSPHNVAGREFIRSGKAGKIGMIRCFVHYGGGVEKPQPNSQPPKGMDWNLWCGPAPLRPFNTRIHTRGFRNFLDYANGTLGDWGIHWMDQVLWIMDAKGPRRVFTSGGRPIKGPVVNDESGQTTDAPDHQVTVFQFDDFSVSWEHRQFAGNNAEKGENVGAYFYGVNGTFHQAWKGGWTFYPTDGGQPTQAMSPKLNEPDQQNIKELFADFLASIQSGKPPVSDIEHGHRSTTMALLGMLSLKAGRSVEWDADRQTIVNDPDAAKLLSRTYRGEWKYPV